jgi:hypothetical protein
MQESVNDQELREILQRAEEIHNQEQTPLEVGPRLQEIAKAAEEAGLSRSAVTQALRERTSALTNPLEQGALVFGNVGEGKFYVAEVLEVEKSHAKVRFLGGSDARLSLEELRPFQFLPGQKVKCPWPDWGWWTCTVVSYDRENRKLRASDGWGSEQTFHISDVFIQPDAKPLVSFDALRARTMVTVVSIAAAGGALIGAVVSWLLMR